MQDLCPLQKLALLFSTLIWEAKRVLWFAKPCFLVGVGRGKGLTSGSKVGEGVPEAFLRGKPYISALGGQEGRSALLPLPLVDG